MTTATKKFYLRVYDNYHYMDESEAYNTGEFETYGDAVIAAKAIVDEFFEHNLKSGISPDQLGVQYALFGDDPIILPNVHGEHERFSAHTYANIREEEICRKMEAL